MSHSRQNTNPYFGGDCCRSPHGERGLKLFVSVCQICWWWSLPSRGAWIEIDAGKHMVPCGGWSLPSRGAWIEIVEEEEVEEEVEGRSPHGERGLKSPCWCSGRTSGRRSPHGERGLKSALALTKQHGTTVAPLTGSVD